VLPSEKQKVKNPDRFGYVYGEFHADANGKAGEKLSFPAKEITIEMARNPLTVIDRDSGILVLPAASRGRPSTEGESQENITALLASLRETAEESATEVTAEVTADAE
jgi:hypothetical protein